MFTCANCGPTEVDHDEKLGHTVCILCGSVMEINSIVSEVTFSENSKGGATADGFQVSSTSARAKSSGKFGLIRPGGAEPREQTIANGHRKISDIASQPQIRMAERHIQAAQRFFNLAVINNFTKGRKANCVVAACLYIVCRTEKTAHMLIDFADALSINVFQIGATFLKLVQLLSIRLPLVDPALYISRFADRLDFGDKTQLVIKDANRIAQRMNRDWLQTGRRPAGICAASLFVSARMHGFERTHKEIVLVVKICEQTLKRRLIEFSNTPSGNLSVADFQTIWLEESKDPPAFIRARARALKLKKSQDKSLSADENESESEVENDIEKLNNELTDDEETLKAMDDMMEILNRENVGDLEKSFASESMDETTIETLSDLDDDLEIQNMLSISTEEVEFKTMLWTDENKDWLANQELKKLQKTEKRPISKSKQRKKQKTQNKSLPNASSAAEAAKNLINSKPTLSKKINYKVLDELFDQTSSSSPSVSPKTFSKYSENSVTGFGAISIEQAVDMA